MKYWMVEFETGVLHVEAHGVEGACKLACELARTLKWEKCSPFDALSVNPDTESKLVKLPKP